MQRTGLRNWIILSALSLIMSSCAKRINDRYQKIYISADSAIKNVKIEHSVFNKERKHHGLLYSYRLQYVYRDTIKPSFNPKIANPVYVRQALQPVVVHYMVDSLPKVAFLYPPDSFANWAICFNDNADLLPNGNKSRRYGYQKWNYLTMEDTVLKLYRFAPIQKGSINFSLSLTFMNLFDLPSTEGRYSSAGAYGIGAGLDYFYKKDHYVSVSSAAGTDLRGEHIGSHDWYTGSCWFISLENNRIIHSFDIGYGIDLMNSSWSKETYIDSAHYSYSSLTNKTLGISLSTSYRCGRYFRIGLRYDSGLIPISRPLFIDYQHYISFNLIWKLPLINR